MAEFTNILYASDKPVTMVLMPTLPSRYLRRFRLDQKFSEALDRQVTLVEAPAGYGKTTSLCGYLSRIARPVAWLSLSKKDSDVFDFWSEILYSVGRAVPGLEKRPKELLMAGADTESVITALINAVAEQSPELVIVLDNYHTITDESVHSSLEYMMRYLSPEMRLIIASRTEFPLNLSFLRGHGQISEIRTEDLRFSAEDTYNLFTETLGIPVTGAIIKTINDRFQGWITGLRMAALTMDGCSDIERLPHFEEKSEQSIMDYFASEVLELQNEAMRDFLLKTSVFSRFCGDMCDNVFESGDSKEMIGGLVSRELFIQIDDECGKWYRYHPIFRDALRRQAAVRISGELPGLYLRASEWSENQGLLEDALNYALEAEAFERASELLNKIMMIILGQDQYDRFWKWLRRLPAKLVNSNLWANIGCAVSCEMTRSCREQAQFVEQSLEISREKSNEILNGYPDADNLLASIRMLQILDAYHKGNMDSAIAYASEGLSSIPTANIQGRCGLMCLKGFSLWNIGELDEAYQCCREAAFLGVMAK